MKVDKAPQTNYFKHGYVSFSKNRKTKELKYSITIWKDNIQFMAETGKVKDEQHLKELQSQPSEKHNYTGVIPNE